MNYDKLSSVSEQPNKGDMGVNYTFLEDHEGLNEENNQHVESQTLTYQGGQTIYENAVKTETEYASTHLPNNTTEVEADHRDSTTGKDYLLPDTDSEDETDPDSSMDMDYFPSNSDTEDERGHPGSRNDDYYFQNYTDRLQLFGNDFPVCTNYNVSCLGRCGGKTAYCQCDEVCIHMGDCCLDYELHCAMNDNIHQENNSKNSIIQIWKNHITELEDNLLKRLIVSKKQYMQCIDIAHGHIYRVITKCPNDSSVEPGMRQKCEEPYVTPDEYSVSPVISQQLIYQNYYCSQCHHQPVSGLTPFEIFFVCHNETIKKQAEYIIQEQDIGQFFIFVNEFCLKTFDNALLHILIERNRLRCSIGYNECSRGTSSSMSNVLCPHIAAPVWKRFIPFHNSFCVACNTDDPLWVQNLICEHLENSRNDFQQIYVYLPSFTIMLDFDSDKSGVYNRQRELCKKGKLFDVIKQNCVSVEETCQTGQFEINGTCDSLTLSQPLFNKPPTFVLMYIYIWQGKVPEYLIHRYIPKLVYRYMPNLYDIKNGMLEKCSPTENNTLLNSKERWLIESALNATCHEPCTCFKQPLYFVASRSFQSIYEDINVHLENMVTSIPSNLKLIGLQLSNYNIETREDTMQCGSGYLAVSEPVTIFESHNGMHVNTTEVESLLISSGVALDILWGVYLNSVSKVYDVVHIRAYTCQHNIRNCTIIKFEESEYNKIKNESVLLTQFNITLSQVEFITNHQNAIYICSDILYKKSHSLMSVFLFYIDNTLGYITLAGNVISMLSLLFTLITYMSFSSLRTLSGLAVIQLIVSLFLAILVFQLSGIIAAAEIYFLCTIAGLAKHFLWLAYFAWTSILTYDLSSLLRHCTVLRESNTNRIWGYATFAWGFPFVIVCLAMVLNEFDILTLTYNMECCCWPCKISSAIIYLYYGPVIILIMGSLVCSTSSMVYLRKALQAGSTVNHRTNKQKLIMYVKIAVLSGVAWLAGMIPIITGIDELWYPAIVLITLQGFYICCSFTLSKQGRGLWAKCLRLTPDTSKSDSLATKTSTTI